MAPSVKAPKASKEEKALQRNQAELLALQRQVIEQQRQQNSVLLPFFAEQEGFDVDTDEFGNITKIAKMFDPLESGRKEIEQLFQERSLAALKGELPVDPALEKALGTQERTLREQLSTQLGTGYETSSPGIESLEQFRSSAETLRAGARNAQLTLAEQLGLVRGQQEIFERNSAQDVLRQSAVGDPMTFAGAFGQTARGFGQAQVPFIQDRQMKLQANVANAQIKSQLMGAGIGAIGSLFSDDRGKLNPVQIGRTLHGGIPIYEYTDAGTGTRKIGVMASDVDRTFPGSVWVDPETGLAKVQYEDIF